MLGEGLFNLLLCSAKVCGCLQVGFHILVVLHKSLAVWCVCIEYLKKIGKLIDSKRIKLLEVLRIYYLCIILGVLRVYVGDLRICV